MRKAATVVSVLLVGLAYVSACTSFGSDPAGDADAGDAGPCAPPACGGAGGRCGMVSACGLQFSCGECAPPYTCVDGTCGCTPAAGLCASEGATCGDLDDGCGMATSCGACGATESCQAKDGGLACASGTCAAEPTTTTCAGKCKKVTNNCGKAITCPACPSDKLCITSGNASTCACPARPYQLKQFADAAHLCYSNVGNCPGVVQGVVATLYAGGQGLVPLYRCRRVISATESSYYLTPNANCDGIKEYVAEGVIGSCATSAVCGAVPLYRYFRVTGNGDFLHSLSPTTPFPGKYDFPFGPACYVWPP